MAQKLSFEQQFSYLGKDLINEIRETSAIKTFPIGTELVREGQYTTKKKANALSRWLFFAKRLNDFISCGFMFYHFFLSLPYENNRKK
jgi:hypothetical protein